METIEAGGLRIERESFGEHFATNCFVVRSVTGGGTVVVDPGQGALPWLEERFADLGRGPDAILVTHGHMDHTWDVLPVARRWSAPVYVHGLDRRYLADPASALAAHFPGKLLEGHPAAIPPDCRETPQQAVSVGGLTWRALHTPGHTPGSVCFVIEDVEGAGACVATGDTVLAHAPGPVFPPLGRQDDHDRSLVSLRPVLRGDIWLLPGHGACAEGPVAWVS